jgi:hypothetical protein
MVLPARSHFLKHLFIACPVHHSEGNLRGAGFVPHAGRLGRPICLSSQAERPDLFFRAPIWRVGSRGRGIVATCLRTRKTLRTVPRTSPHKTLHSTQNSAARFFPFPLHLHLWHFARSPQEDYVHAARSTSMPFCHVAGDRQRQGVVCFAPLARTLPAASSVFRIRAAD